MTDQTAPKTDDEVSAPDGTLDDKDLDKVSGGINPQPLPPGHAPPPHES